MEEYIAYHKARYFAARDEIAALELEMQADQAELRRLKFELEHPDQVFNPRTRPEPPAPVLECRPLSLSPVGYVRNSLLRKFEAPRQPGLGHLKNDSSEFVLQRTRAEASLEPGNYYLFQFAFDRNFTFRPLVLAPKQTRRVGLFSSRTPHRPNPLGLSLGFVEAVLSEDAEKRETVYSVIGLDLLNNTPVMSVRLYDPERFDLPNAKGGWMQDEAEKQQLIPLYYDESGQKEVFGERFEKKYALQNAEALRPQLDFVQEHVKINVDSFLKNVLERVPLLSRTHKTIEKQQPTRVIAIGVFRVYYRVDEEQGTVRLLSVEPSLPRDEIEQTKRFDPDSQMCAAFLERFGGAQE